MTNEDLKNIYEFIKTQYIKLKKPLGILSDIYIEEKWNCVIINNETIGRAFNFSGEHSVYGNLFENFSTATLKPLIGKDMDYAIKYMLNLEGILARSFCLAAINALSKNIFVDCVYNKFSSLTELVNNESVITQIGYNPWATILAEKAKKVFVSDMRKKQLLLKQLDENCNYLNRIEVCSPKNNREIIKKSDIVIFSGCTIVNKTYLDIINWSKSAKAVIIFGPSAEVLPQYLFNLGITHIYNSDYKIYL